MKPKSIAHYLLSACAVILLTCSVRASSPLALEDLDLIRGGVLCSFTKCLTATCDIADPGCAEYATQTPQCELTAATSCSLPDAGYLTCQTAPSNFNQKGCNATGGFKACGDKKNWTCTFSQQLQECTKISTSIPGNPCHLNCAMNP